jgi:hypothetical protein
MHEKYQTKQKQKHEQTALSNKLVIPIHSLANTLSISPKRGLFREVICHERITKAVIYQIIQL